MAVYHILKDGSRPEDISGHVVKIEDAEPLYRMLAHFYEGKTEERTIHNEHYHD